nr:hypothetical protein [Tanacetum cinerariifolium]
MTWFFTLKPWHDDFMVEERLLWLEIKVFPLEHGTIILSNKFLLNGRSNDHDSEEVGFMGKYDIQGDKTFVDNDVESVADIMDDIENVQTNVVDVHDQVFEIQEPAVKNHLDTMGLNELRNDSDHLATPNPPPPTLLPATTSSTPRRPHHHHLHHISNPLPTRPHHLHPPLCTITTIPNIKRPPPPRQYHLHRNHATTIAATTTKKGALVQQQHHHKVRLVSQAPRAPRVRLIFLSATRGAFEFHAKWGCWFAAEHTTMIGVRVDSRPPQPH